MSENTFWVTIWVILAAALIGGIGMALHHNRENTRMMIEAGYTKEFVAGKQEQEWVKHEQK